MREVIFETHLQGRFLINATKQSKSYRFIFKATQELISSLSTCVHGITLLYLTVLHIQTAVAPTQTIISSRKHPPGTHGTGDMGVGLSQAFWGALRYPWQ